MPRGAWSRCALADGPDFILAWIVAKDRPSPGAATETRAKCCRRPQIVYNVDIKPLMRSKALLGVATVAFHGRCDIYRAKEPEVGLFQGGRRLSAGKVSSLCRLTGRFSVLSNYRHKT